MSFTPTTNYSLLRPDVNTEFDTWGDDLNDNWVKVDTQLKTNADAIVSAVTVAPNSVDNVKLANMPANTIKGCGPVAGDPADLNAAEVTTILPVFSSTKGLVPGSSGGTVNFLCANGSWSAPPTGSVADNSVSTIKLVNDSVTNAKLANMAANTIKGSVAGGDPADLAAADVLTITGAATVTQLTDGITKEAQVAKTATFVLTAAEVGKMVTFNSASAVSCTVNSGVFSAGHRVDILQLGAGQVTVGGTATQRSRSGTKLAGQYAGATIWFISASEYVLMGDTTV